MSRFDGDPYIQLTEDGAEMTFAGGQPIMDKGLENHALISLMTERGWWGNSLESDPNKKPGAKYLEVARQPITVEMLKRLRQSAIAALTGPAFKSVDAFIQEFGHGRVQTQCLVTPPSRETQALLLETNGQNWINQKNNPAYNQV